MPSEQLRKVQKILPEDAEMAVDALDAPCLVKPTNEEDAAARSQMQDGSKGRYSKE